MYLHGQLLPYMPDAYGRRLRPALRAALFWHIDVMKFVVEQNLCPFFETIYKEICQECCKGGSIEVLEYLLSLQYQSTLNLSDLIEYAIQGGSLAAVKLLHRKFDTFDNSIVTLVHYSIVYEKLNILNFC
jgi:hypothetical protein